MKMLNLYSVLPDDGIKRSHHIVGLFTYVRKFATKTVQK